LVGVKFYPTNHSYARAEKITYAITYGYLPYAAKSCLGEYTPENGFGALLDNFFNSYPGIMAFYTLKEGFFETWYIGVEQEILTEKDTYEGTKELKLTSLFNCSSIRVSDRGQSTILVVASYSEEHTVEVKSTTPNYTSTYELTGENFTTKLIGEKRYIWNMTNSQELDDITISLQLKAGIENNQPGPPALTVVALIAMVLIIVAIIIRRRKRHRTPEQVNLRLQQEPAHPDQKSFLSKILKGMRFRKKEKVWKGNRKEEEGATSARTPSFNSKNSPHTRQLH